MKLEWKDVRICSQYIANLLQQKADQIDCIVGIAMGGMPIAYQVAEITKHPVVPVLVQRYGSKKEGGEVRVVQPIDEKYLKGKRVFIVDDVEEDGITMTATQTILRAAGATVVGSFVMVSKASSDPIAEWFIQTVKSDWVTFPWEV